MKEKINIAELLKDCPSDMELDCTMFENVTLSYVSENVMFPIKIKTPIGKISLNKYGGYTSNELSKCVIFPKGKTTWEGFQRPFKDGDIVATENGLFIGIIKIESGMQRYAYVSINNVNNLSRNAPYIFERLATEEEKQKLFNAIKDNGYKWNVEQKTLEKLVEPRFKVGDRIKSKIFYTNFLSDNHIFTITEISRGRYWSNRLAIEYIEKQDDWELVPDKFDITTLKPFESKVLVRNFDDGIWEGAIFGRYDGKKFFTIGALFWGYCIPYEGNEHLLGTTNDCDEFYKTWKN